MYTGFRVQGLECVYVCDQHLHMKVIRRSLVTTHIHTHQVTAIKRTVKQHVSDLQQERALIQWILTQLSTARLSPSAALGRVEQSLTQEQGLDTMGDLQKILEAAHAISGGGGRGRLPALAAEESGASGAGLGEWEEVAAILRELIADLAQREKVFGGMVGSAEAQLAANSRKYAEWQGSLNAEAAGVEKSRAAMSSQEQRRHVLAGRLLAAQQQVDAMAEGLPAQAAMLSASIASYQRVVTRLLEKSRAVCAPITLEEQAAEEEEEALPELMMRLRQRTRQAKRLESLIRDTRVPSSPAAGKVSELRRIKDAAKVLLRAASPASHSQFAGPASAPSSSEPEAPHAASSEDDRGARRVQRDNVEENALLQSVQLFAEKAAAAGILPPTPLSTSVNVNLASVDRLQAPAAGDAVGLSAFRTEHVEAPLALGLRAWQSEHVEADADAASQPAPRRDAEV